MTERFSQQYIDFVTQSKPIQAHWQKRGARVGDWFVYWIEGSKDKPVLLPFLYGFNQKIARWLPTLSDLLEGLESSLREQCGYALSFNEHESDSGHVYRCYEITPLEWLEILDMSPCDEMVFSAARLLERVLAGKEDTT